ncbi:MAG TPA: LysR family transcriptional regulator [Magnetospirillaceae bacterium]|jgi:DNA-binding transcriptional LysR family regulator
MDRDLLTHLPVVLAVARRQGFAAAASELGMSPSAVSHAVQVVERRLGTPLFARTTRSVALTEAGEALMGTVGRALGEIEDGLERIQAAKGKVSGLLRLNVPRLAQALVMTPVLAALGQRHPDLRVESFGSDALVDIVAEGFDAGIRLGEMIAEDMVTVRLTPPFRAILIAAPDYVARHGKPRSLDDLAAHNCIAYRLIQGRGLYRWDLLAADGRAVSIDTPGAVIVNDPLYARDLALAGIGIAYLFEPLARDDIAAGRLVQLLPKSAIEEPGLFLYFPKGAATAPKLRAFIDTARDVMTGKRGPRG